jgi:hypothetical protein
MIGFIATSVTSSFNRTYYSAIADYTLSSPPLHTHQDSQSLLVVFWQRISTEKLTLQITVKSSPLQSPWNLRTKICPWSAFSIILEPLIIHQHGTHRKHVSHVRQRVNWSVTSAVRRNCASPINAEHSNKLHTELLGSWTFPIVQCSWEYKHDVSENGSVSVLS